jgi:CRISPR-associated endonuclease/helicase Cas3
MAGVDSLAQAAGRCNRNGEFPGLGRFVIFKPARHDAIPTPLVDLRRRAGEAREVLRQHADPLGHEAIASFFDRIIARDPSELDRDRCWHRLNAPDAQLANIPFRDVADDFRMITDVTAPLIVRWRDEASDLIERLRAVLRPDAPQPRRLPLDVLRRLQSYTVGCYSLPRLQQFGDVVALDPEERFHVLENAAVYDKSTGLDLARIGLRSPEDNIW